MHNALTVSDHCGRSYQSDGFAALQWGAVEITDLVVTLPNVWVFGRMGGRFGLGFPKRVGRVVVADIGSSIRRTMG